MRFEPEDRFIKRYDNALVVKISDFGLVKTPDSALTAQHTEFKGYFNDPALVTDGFDTYGVLHETYALTKLLYFVMSGKTNVTQISDHALKQFVQKGLDTNKSRRDQSVGDLNRAFRNFTATSRKILETSMTDVGFQNIANSKPPEST